MLKGKKIDFMGNKKKYFIISSALMAIILIWTLVFGAELDIDFKGGTILSYAYSDSVDLNEVEQIAEDVLQSKVTVVNKDSLMGETKSVDITLASSVGLDSDLQAKLDETLVEKFSDNNFEQLSVTSVKPTMGREFFMKCLVAVAFGSILMVIYIAFRFKKISGWSAGAMAVVALIHDILIIYGTFVLAGIPINDNFIAVVLTILGYSVNDTIVIYDRIRENNLYYEKTKPVAEIVNMSLNQSITRSINTSVSTIMAMVVVCVVAMLTGVTSIISFALPMIVGLISGAYSSICIATPLWVMWQERKLAKQGR